MYENIFYNNGKAYRILRKIKEHNLDPRPYGVSDTHENRMKILQAWRDHIGGNHVMRTAMTEQYLICEVIEEAKIIEK
tara:strand:- start:51845 stop:52078 length:234 start_codon:yes stop_codon:yes gene_type:complete